MISVVSKNNLLCYVVDTSKFEHVNEMKQILVGFAEKIDVINMNNIPMQHTIELMKKAQVDIKPDDQKDEPNQDIPQDIVHTSDSSQITLLCLSMLITILFFNLIYPKKKDN